MRVIFLSLALLFSSILYAAEEAGIVILSLGGTSAISADGQARELKRGAKIFSGDRLETGKGRLQIRFTDDSMLSLQPGSVFEVSEYEFDAENPNDGSVVMELIKGGMRTISGKVGKEEREDYRLSASVATIGIRGTHYAVQICDVDCAVSRNVAEGVTGRVIDGAIQVTTDSTAELVSKEEYFFADRISGDISVTSEPPDSYDSAAQAATDKSQTDIDADREEILAKGGVILERLSASKYLDLLAADYNLTEEQAAELAEKGFVTQPDGTIISTADAAFCAGPACPSGGAVTVIIGP